MTQTTVLFLNIKNPSVGTLRDRWRDNLPFVDADNNIIKREDIREGRVVLRGLSGKSKVILEITNGEGA